MTELSPLGTVGAPKAPVLRLRTEDVRANKVKQVWTPAHTVRTHARNCLPLIRSLRRAPLCSLPPCLCALPPLPVSLPSLSLFPVSAPRLPAHPVSLPCLRSRAPFPPLSLYCFPIRNFVVRIILRTGFRPFLPPPFNYA
eukprot:364809-Chlamydomonas_euryale.AAC.3